MTNDDDFPNSLTSEELETIVSALELDTVLQLLNTYAKSLNYDTRNGESKSIGALRSFASKVSVLQLDYTTNGLLWELIDNLSEFQRKVRRKLKEKTKKECNDLIRVWGAFAILAVALSLIVVLFVYGLLTSSSLIIFACFGCSSVALAVVALFYYGEYGKACELLQSVIDKVDLIKELDAKLEQLNETLNRHP